MRSNQIISFPGGILSLILLWGVISCQSWETAEAPSPRVWQGFGVSAAWWPQEAAASSENRETIARLLFDAQDGAGLTWYRYNLGAGIDPEISDPWRTTPTFLPAKGEWDWQADPQGLAMAQAAVQAARESGSDVKIILFANSPPRWMTISGSSFGGPGGPTNLAPGMYGIYADYLLECARYLREEEGLPVAGLSPINEPQWNWSQGNGQEGCHYEPEEAAALMKVVARRKKERGYDWLTLAAPESGEWKGRARAYVKALMADPLLREELDHLDIHSYWSWRRHKASFHSWLKKNYPDKGIIMSEWTEMKSGRDAGIDSALTLARTIVEDINVGGVSGWHYWIGVSRYDWRDGLLYADEDSEGQWILTETKRLWALAQFSRFLRPGMLVHSLGKLPAGVKGIGFSQEEAGHRGAVLINSSRQEKEINPADLWTGKKSGSAPEAWRTSATDNLEPVPLTPERLILLPRSITTYRESIP